MRKNLSGGIAALGLVVVACSSPAEGPLGGPFGGSSTSAVDPGSGGQSGSGSSSSSSGGSLSGSGSSGNGSSGGGSSSSGSNGGGSFSGGSSSSSSSSGGKSSGSGSSGSSSSGSSSSGGGSSSGSSSGGSSSGGSSSGGTTAPTWSELTTKYLAAGTPGNCAQSGCHSQCSTASGCYTWLSGKGYISGGINNNGLFTWTPNGFMPINGPGSEPQAVTDFATWTAAGSLNN